MPQYLRGVDSTRELLGSNSIYLSAHVLIFIYFEPTTSRKCGKTRKETPNGHQRCLLTSNYVHKTPGAV